MPTSPAARPPPADDIFAHFRCPQSVPARSLCPDPGPRKRRGRRHRLAGLLAVGIAAVIAGSKSFAAIGQQSADADPDVLAGLGAMRGAAEQSTVRRAFALPGPARLDQALGAWLHTRAVRGSGRLVTAIDGKAVRGARDKDGKAPHLVAALAHGIGAVLGQVAVDAGSNEIPAVRDLLKAFTDLAGAVITTGALHTQSDTAQAITGRHADYVMTVKGNMPTLYRQLKKLPWARIPAVSSVSTGHGRRSRYLMYLEITRWRHVKPSLAFNAAPDPVTGIRPRPGLPLILLYVACVTAPLAVVASLVFGRRAGRRVGRGRRMSKSAA